MNIAQPSRIVSVGRSVGQVSRFAIAASSSTNPSRVAPRSESGLSADFAWIVPPVGSVARQIGRPSVRVPGIWLTIFSMTAQPCSASGKVGATHQTFPPLMAEAMHITTPSDVLPNWRPQTTTLNRDWSSNISCCLGWSSGSLTSILCCGSGDPARPGWDFRDIDHRPFPGWLAVDEGELDQDRTRRCGRGLGCRWGETALPTLEELPGQIRLVGHRLLDDLEGPDVRDGLRRLECLVEVAVGRPLLGVRPALEP